MLGNYLQQTTSADDIFRCIFSWRLRVNLQVFLQSNDIGLSSDVIKDSIRDLIQQPRNGHTFKTFFSTICGLHIVGNKQC